MPFTNPSADARGRAHAARPFSPSHARVMTPIGPLCKACAIAYWQGAVHAVARGTDGFDIGAQSACQCHFLSLPARDGALRAHDFRLSSESRKSREVAPQSTKADWRASLATRHENRSGANVAPTGAILAPVAAVATATANKTPNPVKDQPLTPSLTCTPPTGSTGREPETMTGRTSSGLKGLVLRDSPVGRTR